MDLMFPVEWRFGDSPTDGIGGEAVEDAGTIYIVRDEENEDDFPNGDEALLVKKTTLDELVIYCIDGWRNGDGYTDKDHVPASDALAEALRKAANLLDAAKRKPSQELTRKNQ